MDATDEQKNLLAHATVQLTCSLHVGANGQRLEQPLQAALWHFFVDILIMIPKNDCRVQWTWVSPHTQTVGHFVGLHFDTTYSAHLSNFNTFFPMSGLDDLSMAG